MAWLGLGPAGWRPIGTPAWRVTGGSGWVYLGEGRPRPRRGELPDAAVARLRPSLLVLPGPAGVAELPTVVLAALAGLATSNPEDVSLDAVQVGEDRWDLTDVLDAALWRLFGARVLAATGASGRPDSAQSGRSTNRPTPLPGSSAPRPASTPASGARSRPSAPK